jgi:hypothetical protein
MRPFCLSAPQRSEAWGRVWGRMSLDGALEAARVDRREPGQ